MTWLIRRKKWVTLSEAATYLSTKTTETLTEKDLIHLAVSGEIKISAYFGDPTPARAETVHKSSVEGFSETFYGDPFPIEGGIAEVWDLRPSGQVIRINSQGEIESALFPLVFDSDIENRVVRILETTLPDSAQWVLRGEVLLSLEAEINGSQNQLSQPDKPLHSSERKSIYQIIATLAAIADVDLSKPYAADTTLRAAAAQYGLQMPNSPETVVKFLSEAAAFKDKS
ncbi:hypothetical protein LX59_00010 [Azomonas agilis]|uniref:Uncharacterized protein n=1 Tax=Azomonas agilis TaxID=116849 RepID=A0A562J1R0_9GAMM|nr:hypothetical protein [Azomonas agilis]TWH77108.1 hypothetical protein LX59_00010 [Azomonas agilis]